MSLYKDYLTGGSIWLSKIQNLKDKYRFWHLQRKSAKRVKEIENQELEVHNKKELWKAVNNNKFYRTCF